MPSTEQEVEAIVKALSKFESSVLSRFLLARELHLTVGQCSDNEVVQNTFALLYAKTAVAAYADASQHRSYRSIVYFLEDVDDWFGFKSPIPSAKSDDQPEPDFTTAFVDYGFKWSDFGWLGLWALIVVGHVAVWIGLLLSCVLATTYQPWYVAMPIISFCVYLLTTDVMCPVTRWENAVRRQLGWPELANFTHWYMVCPFFHPRQCDRCRLPSK
jgi:hypothetical protein